MAAVLAVASFEPPAGSEMLPGERLAWSAVDPRVIDASQVILEGPQGPSVLCPASSECAMPDELPAGTDFVLWVRAHTSRGTVRSEDVPVRTPALPWTIRPAPLPERGLPPHGGLAWTVEGGTPAASFALLRLPGQPPVLCAGAPRCATSDPLLPGERYAVEIRAYDDRGLYVAQALGPVRANRPPSPAGAAHPAVGHEVGVGRVNLQWSASSDPDQDAVRYTVEHRLGGVSGWTSVPTGAAREHALEVPNGETVVWRVLAEDDAGHATPSAYFHFHTPDAPQGGIPLWPIRGDTVAPRANVAFQFIPGLTATHRVMLRPQGAGAWQDACGGLQGCEHRADLRPDTTYEWKAVGQSTYLGQASSPVETFRTVAPVVLVHGIFGSTDTWKQTGRYLEERGLAVVDFKTRVAGTQAMTWGPPEGHGRVGASQADVDYAEYVKDEVKDWAKDAVKQQYAAHHAAEEVGEETAEEAAREQAPGCFPPVVYKFLPQGKRQGIREISAEVVAPLIRAAMEANGYPNGTGVVLVGHSMGGLVARTITDEGFLPQHPTRALLTLATPHLGSATAKTLFEGLQMLLDSRVLEGITGVPCISETVRVGLDYYVGNWYAALHDAFPHSKYLERLNGLPSPAPYRAVAGTEDFVVGLNSATHGARGARFLGVGHSGVHGHYCMDLVVEWCDGNLQGARTVLEWLVDEAPPSRP